MNFPNQPTPIASQPSTTPSPLPEGAKPDVGEWLTQERLKALAQTVLSPKQEQEMPATPSPEASLPLPASPKETPALASPPESMTSTNLIKEGLDTFNFLRMSVAQGISDIHFRIGYPPIIRKDGDMMFTRLPALTRDTLDSFIHEVVPAEAVQKMHTLFDYDFNFQLPGLARFRVNWFHEMGQPGLVLRIIKEDIPNIADLGLPAVVKEFAYLHKGLVLITGPTGSGKTTTLAALLNEVNLTQSKHIITLEDPIEYVYTNQKAVITQRQLGLDTDSFPNGIKYALRQDPDVVLVGEMRDRETIMAALHAAETGHMVFSTLHTINAVQTIYRIVNMFEPHEREPIRRQISSVLQGTVSQRLVKRADGKGRLAVAEVLKVNPAIKDYIYRDQIEEIYSMLSNTNNPDGSISLNYALHQAVVAGQITAEEAMLASENTAEMSQLLRGFYSNTVR